MVTLILVIVIIISSYLFLRRKKDPWDEPSPPHPPLHPLLGNIPTLKKLDPIIHYAFQSLGISHGPVLRLKLGNKWNLLVTGFEEMKVCKVLLLCPHFLHLLYLPLPPPTFSTHNASFVSHPHPQPISLLLDN